MTYRFKVVLMFDRYTEKHYFVELDSGNEEAAREQVLNLLIGDLPITVEIVNRPPSMPLFTPEPEPSQQELSGGSL